MTQKSIAKRGTKTSGNSAIKMSLVRFLFLLGIAATSFDTSQAWALGSTYVAQDCADGCTAQDTLAGVGILSSSYTYCNNGHGGFRGSGKLHWCSDCPSGFGWDETTTSCVPSVNGQCGAANKGSYSSAPHTASYLCNTGTASSVATTSNGWSWSCAGAYGGTPASCSATSCTPQ